MAITKPDYTYIWASGGAIVEPSDTKKQTGWGQEVPPHQWENWAQNRQDTYLAHINERGIPEWDGLTEYLASGLSYVQGSNGVVYKSVAASGPSTTSQDPTTDATDTYWTVAFADVGAFLTEATADARYLQVLNNGSDINNATTFRTNIGVYSKTEVDTLNTFNDARVTVASASNVDLTSLAPDTSWVYITGTTTINSFTIAAGRKYFVEFADALTLTNSASLVTNTGSNITTYAGAAGIIGATAANVVSMIIYPKKARGSLTSDGYVFIPMRVSGVDREILVQWMNATESTNSSTERLWPITFPNACLWATTTPSENISAAGGVVSEISTTGVIFKVGNNFGDGTTGYVMGIGW